MAKRSRGRQQATRRRDREKKAKRRTEANPYKRAGERGDLVKCTINANWKDNGMATVFVLRRMPDGALGMSTFLIDIWCMGLKDAWGRLDMTMAEFDEIMTTYAELRFEDTDFATVQRLVAGSIRFAHENGFRLPRRYDRWTMLAGIRTDGDDASGEAPLRDFRRDGCLVYMGPLDDLRKRLIGQSIEEFLGRDDVRFALGIDGTDGTEIVGNSQELMDEFRERAEIELEDLDDIEPGVDEVEDELDMLEDELAKCRDGLLDGVRRWCFSKRVEPHPRLADAWSLQELALFQAAEAPPGADIETFPDAVGAFLDRQAPQERNELIAALEQIKGFMNQFESQDEMLAAIGFDD